ncbi:helix-turn-helix domain-containing protein, partial [Sinorhizobium fredii]|uniref:helix-turn-helix domain-containing protein n=3 Tax=Rhizobium fredii TaxID=380 RepID=UPI00192D730B
PPVSVRPATCSTSLASASLAPASRPTLKPASSSPRPTYSYDIVDGHGGAVAQTATITIRVLALIAEGRSYRWIARDLGISKDTVADVVQRFRPIEPSRRPVE